ncbi:MAG: hypothetical protein R3E97_24770 [Candidatus Eisenbacteria bacterium]
MRFEKALDTSIGTAQIVTDAGKCYCKAMGNPQGTQALACELVGTGLAEWLGLKTFEYGVLDLGPAVELPFIKGGRADSGPAFVTRAEAGNAWGGSSDELTQLKNLDDIPKLVVLDTWTLNCDRCSPAGAGRNPHPDNVFFSWDQSRSEVPCLVAMDHSHCFVCGAAVNKRVANIDNLQDRRIYGLFPAFRTVVASRRALLRESLSKLKTFRAEDCRDLLARVPRQWGLDQPSRDALCDLVTFRARFVGDNMMEWLEPLCWPQGELTFDDGME